MYIDVYINTKIHIYIYLYIYLHIHTHITQKQEIYCLGHRRGSSNILVALRSEMHLGSFFLFLSL